MIRKWCVKGQIPETQLPERETPERTMCPECGNKYFPHEKPTDCLVCGDNRPIWFGDNPPMDEPPSCV
jgi:hypothetical protein